MLRGGLSPRRARAGVLFCTSRLFAVRLRIHPAHPAAFSKASAALLRGNAVRELARAGVQEAMSTITEVPLPKSERKVIDQAVIRFAGDSGDGMQITGSQFTNTVALYGNDIATFPDYPAEIRAPAGTLPGVSGFQLNFSSSEVYTPGDAVDVLIAINPAALKVNVGDLKANGILIVNSDSFKETDLRKAQVTSNPLEDHSLDKFRLFSVELERLTRVALEHLGLDAKSMDRCKNFFALGMC